MQAHDLLREYTQFAHQLADISRSLFLPHLGRRPDVEIKADHTLVTPLDQAIEQRLRERIIAHYPTHGIYGEEGGTEHLDAEWLWVLDPIDGTAPFIAGVPVFGTLIALLHRGMPVIGIMDFPSTQDRWVGIKGERSTHNGAPCYTRDCYELPDAMVTASNPDFFNAEQTRVFEFFRQQTRWRLYGTCCLAYGLLASGRTDIAVDAKLKLYDYAPFIPVIQGAGGVITDWSGKPLSLHHSSPQVLAAATPELHKKALSLISSL